MLCTTQISFFPPYIPSFIWGGGGAEGEGEHLFTQYINQLPSLSTIYKLHGMF